MYVFMHTYVYGNISSYMRLCMGIDMNIVIYIRVYVSLILGSCVRCLTYTCAMSSENCFGDNILKNLISINIFLFPNYNKNSP